MRRLLIALGFLALAPTAMAEDVAASAPRTLSVTVYRNPYRGGGSIALDRLGGFALVTETRTVHLPAGESRLRFEGVVDGIEPASALVTGLPGGVIEKNRDAALLSPETVVRASLGADVTLVRTNPRTGKVMSERIAIRSANDEGVVVQTPEGIEAFKCTGMPETMRFDRIPAGLSSTPTLSVLTRTPRPITATVTLSYLAKDFDWAADYVARINPDGRTLDLGAWITLANGNGVGLPGASTQIVAGRLNRAGGGDDQDDDAPQVLARCWPSGTTSDPVPPSNITLVHPYGFDERNYRDEVVLMARRIRGVPAPMMALAAPAVLPRPPPPEQLGDLKLYRVPQPTTVAAHQSKQVRLLEQPGVPFTRLASADLPAIGATGPAPATVLLRTKNTLADKLGLPLPSGRVAVFGHGGGRELLLGEVNLQDTAVDEDVELRLGVSPDVQIRQTRLSYKAGALELTMLTPEIGVAMLKGEVVEEIEITNARASPTAFELRLHIYGTQHVTAADQPIGLKDGRPIFRLTLPANGTIKIRYTVAG